LGVPVEVYLQMKLKKAVLGGKYQP
jgi:hypothetical protein